MRPLPIVLRPDHRGREAHPRDLVGPRQQCRVHNGGTRRVGADVRHVIDGDRLDHPVAVDGNLHPPHLVARVRRADEVLAAVLDPLDRAAEQPGRQDDGAFLPEHEHLLAESATDVVSGDPHGGFGQVRGSGRRSCASRARSGWSRRCEAPPDPGPRRPRSLASPSAPEGTGSARSVVSTTCAARRSASSRSGERAVNGTATMALD